MDKLLIPGESNENVKHLLIRKVNEMEDIKAKVKEMLRWVGSKEAGEFDGFSELQRYEKCNVKGGLASLV